MNDGKMEQWLDCLPGIVRIHRESFVPDRPFPEIAARFSDDPGTVLLLSGSNLDASQYHILALKPWLKIKTKQKTASLTCFEKKQHLSADPFGLVQAILNRFRTNLPLTQLSPDLPVLSGLFGYFAYDLKDQIEDLPRTAIDIGLPDLVLYSPSLILIQEKKTGKTHMCITVLSKPESHKSDEEQIHQAREFFFNRLAAQTELEEFSIDSSGFTSSLTKDEYISSVRKIIDYLKAGDIYQANLSQRFEAGFSGSAYALFLDLFKRNPASFFAYIHATDHIIVSTSPERFIKQSGRYVETRPIKGTIARGKTKTEDQENGNRLCKSEKDQAELTMIVDLMRNDLSRVTTHGSVIVREHKRLEPYENVFHLVSIIEGELQQDKTAIDLLRATFPGGSITGCPKIRSMEIIDELEPLQRHVYTGSIGYISFHDTMDLSIAIRTALIFRNRIYFSVGGGIVYDSEPEKEYQETLDKGKTLMESLAATSKISRAPGIKAWVNGKLVDQKNAAVSALSLGFQYGAGLFETLRADKGFVFRLDDHISRMEASWQHLFSEPAPDISWKDVIKLLIRENNLKEKQIAVKLIIAKDEQDSLGKGLPAAFVREYSHRLEMLEKEGLDIVTYPFPRQSPLADHKTLNYFYYYQAMQYAKDRNADESIILNPDGSVSETNTAAILSIKNRTVIIPKSPNCLASVTLKSVLTMLSNEGYDIRQKKIGRNAFHSCPNIYLVNALMGAVKVLSIDGKKIEYSENLCPWINENLFRIST